MKTLQLYVEELNKKGGVLGRQLELVHYDDGSDANKANGFAKRLLDDDKVDLDRISLVFAKRGYSDLIEMIGVLNSSV